uniref:Putative photoprotein-like protein n=1 Tax=Hormiphora californensis TaxID=1403702 RepID=A0A0A0S1Q7_HORCA|nr:putative photoprotein-like protein [Hormiphora californensis]
MGLLRRGRRRRPSLLKDPYWRAQMVRLFHDVDKDKNGYLTIEEMIANTRPLKEHCNAPEFKMEALAAAYTEFWGQVGLRRGKKVKKSQFLKGLSRLGREELNREAAGVPTLHSKVSHALFDIIDANNNNRLQKREIAQWMAASGLNPDDAEKMFQEADTKGKGYISREELIEAEFCSFFHPEKCMAQLGVKVV